ncbi:carboxymuconolactone decarboxylase family protein [Streptomyces sp. SID13726]|nr:carboxymuconolactone decarboxylase family protein [Streptomyces sp. SID13726]
MGRARDNGVSDSELIALVTHLAFYAGWPKAMCAHGRLRRTCPPAASGPR